MLIQMVVQTFLWRKYSQNYSRLKTGRGKPEDLQEDLPEDRKICRKTSD